MNLNERLREARKNKKLTQDEVSQRTGIKNTTISNWENGVSRPDVDSLSVLCALYEVSPNDILDYEPNTIAAHHEGDWTKEELEEIERFKEYVKSKRKI